MFSRLIPKRIGNKSDIVFQTDFCYTLATPVDQIDFIEVSGAVLGLYDDLTRRYENGYFEHH